MGAFHDLIVEAGANIGAHTVFFAQAVGAEGVVFAFEPQRLVFQTLCANVALNSLTNVYCYEMALGSAAGKIPVPCLDPYVLQNFGGLGLDRGLGGLPVDMTTIDALELPHCHLIKIDVEGMELQVLEGALKTITGSRPILYVENDRPEKSEALIRFIKNLDYEVATHEPPLFTPENFFRNPDNVFPNLVSQNLVCRPRP